MNKLTAGVSCFALAAVFTWVAGTVLSSAISARARATNIGAVLIADQPISSNGVSAIATSAAVLMLVIGTVCIISELRRRSTR